MMSRGLRRLVWAASISVLVSGCHAESRAGTSKVTVSDTITVAQVKVGTCLLSVPHYDREVAYLASCEDAHQAQAVGRLVLPDDVVIGTPAADARTLAQCTTAARQFTGTPSATPLGYDVSAAGTVAIEGASPSTDRSVLCVIADLRRHDLYGSAAGAGPQSGRQSGDLDPSDLVVGNCITAVPSGTVNTVTLVPCAKPHAAEVFSAFTLPAGGYPGEKAIEDRVDARCARDLPPFIDIPSGLGGYEFGYIYPTKEHWHADRVSVCLLQSPDQTPLTGEAKRKGRRH